MNNLNSGLMPFASVINIWMWRKVTKFKYVCYTLRAFKIRILATSMMPSNRTFVNLLTPLWYDDWKLKSNINKCGDILIVIDFRLCSMNVPFVLRLSFNGDYCFWNDERYRGVRPVCTERLEFWIPGEIDYFVSLSPVGSHMCGMM